MWRWKRIGPTLSATASSVSAPATTTRLRDEQLRAEAAPQSAGGFTRRRPSGSRRRAPCGCSGSSPSLWRRLAMCTSTTWSSPNQLGPQTRSSSWARLSTSRGSRRARRAGRTRARQLDRRAVHADLARGDVDLKLAEPPQLWRRCGARTAQHRPDPRDQLARRERLGQVVVGADSRGRRSCRPPPPRGQHQDVGVAEGAHPPADLDPVDPGQHQVEHDHVRIELRANSTARSPSAELATSIPSRSRYAVTILTRGGSSSTTSARTAGASPARPTSSRPGAHSALATNAPCHQCGQTAPV